MTIKNRHRRRRTLYNKAFIELYKECNKCFLCQSSDNLHLIRVYGPEPSYDSKDMAYQSKKEMLNELTKHNVICSECYLKHYCNKKVVF